jgi:hypothetical protein
MILDDINVLIEESNIEKIAIGSASAGMIGGVMGKIMMSSQINMIRKIADTNLRNSFIAFRKQNPNMEFEDFWKIELQSRTTEIKATNTIFRSKTNDEIAASLEELKEGTRLLWDDENTSQVISAIVGIGIPAAIIGGILTSIYLITKSLIKKGLKR